MPTSFRVLLVEDDDLLRRSLKHVLRRFETLTVFAAASLREALSVLRSESVDVILTDLNLGDGKGVEFGQYRASGMGLILMTAETVGQSEQDAYRESGFAVLEKPFSPNDCFEAIVAASKVRVGD